MDFYISDDVLKDCCITGQKAVVPDGVREIGSRAFSGNRNLRSITLPASLTTIREEAFSNTRLDWLEFPDSVTEVGKDIFYECSIVEVIIFGESYEVDELAEEYDYVTEADIAEEYGLDPEEPSQAIEAVRFSIASELPVLLLGGQFDNLWMPKNTRCTVIVCALRHQPKHANFLGMVKTHITQLFPYLLNELEIVQFLINNAVITSENSDECIRIAQEHNATELEMLLNTVNK